MGCTKNHAIKLNPIYNIAVQVLLPLNRLIFSYAKLENVVNPPQNPIAIKCLSELSGFPVLCRYPKISPIIKLPIMFTDRVWMGNLKWKYLFEIREIVYLKILPTPPPIPTNIICLNMILNLNMQNNQKYTIQRIYCNINQGKLWLFL